jgi:hypothetical protein
MARVLAKVAAVAVALGVLGGAAQAGGIDIRITTSDRAYGTVGSRYDVDDDDFGRRRTVAPRHDDHEYREPNRYYGRPIPQPGYWERHSYSRPVVAVPAWGHSDQDCRIVVRRNVNDWGQVVIKRKRVCD